MVAHIAKVLFPVNLDIAFDYAVPFGMSLAPGQFVTAPLGQQMKTGVVWAVSQQDTDFDLKDIAELRTAPALRAQMLTFVDWVARYNCAPKGMVLRMVMRSLKALSPSAQTSMYSPNSNFKGQITAARRLILDAGGPFPATASDIATRAQVSASTVRKFADIGGLDTGLYPVDAPFGQPDPDLPSIALSPAQSQAAQELILQVSRGTFNVSLLDGVTGSGKTEVYFEAVAQALREGGQALVLVPEIALTQAGMQRFEARFGVSPAPWHSALGEAARRRTYREVLHGRANLVVGARSALFLPFPDLRVIVVDEEHDGSYKQEEGVIYNARDMAVVRAKLEQASVVLASATPALESLNNAQSGRYAHIILPERPGSITLPDITLIDLKHHVPAKGNYLSQPLIDAVAARLSQGEQSLLYLNRRGFAPQILCRVCGEKLKSPDTDSWLVEHKSRRRAVCHHTGYSRDIPTQCESCGAEDSLVGVGPGVERVAEEAARHFPDAKIDVLSSDTSGSAEDIRARMARMTDGDIDILVGTQMVVKGHNFPKLTFVGVVDGDLSLTGGDLRAGERTYQTLVQVAGRAGRASRPGEALIQTHQPEHEALQALEEGNRARFIDAEMATREMLGLPPFGRLAAIIVSDSERNRIDDLAREVRRLAPHVKDKAGNIDIMGPSEPPLSRLRGRYRRRLLVRSDLGFNLSAYMQDWQTRVKLPKRARIQIDIDPQSFF